MQGLLLVALGGALGASARYGVNLFTTRSLGAAPYWSTLSVNVIGCFVMGIVIALSTDRLSYDVRLFLTTGVLGGFTTFSAFAGDVATLTRDGASMTAIVYVLASVTLSLLAVFAGLSAARVLV